MKTIHFDRTPYQVKTFWNELTKDDLEKTLWLLAQYRDQGSEAQKHGCAINLFRILSNVPENLILTIGADQWFDLLKLVEWVFEAPRLQENPLPEIKIGFRRKIQGPKGLLSNSSFGEFRSADDAFLAYCNGKNPEALWLLIAILWRPVRKDLVEFRSDPKKWNGDTREPFNFENAKIRASGYKRRIPFHLAIGVLLYYWSARDQMLVNNGRLKGLFNGSGRKSSMNLGWLEPLLEMSGSKFGTITETDEHNWLLILAELAREIYRAEKLKEEINKK